MWLSGGAYQAWATFLERWAQGDAAGMDRLPVVDPEKLNAETMTRLANRLVDALSTRLQAWADSLTRALSAESDEFSVGRSLTQARVGLVAVRSLAGHPGLPEELRRQLLDIVDRVVESAQQQLEKDVDRLGQLAGYRQMEARRRTIRDNSLTAAPDVAPDASAPAPDAWYVDPGVRTPRRIIVQDRGPRQEGA